MLSPIKIISLSAIFAVMATGCSTASKNQPAPMAEPPAPVAMPAPAPVPVPDPEPAPSFLLHGVNFDLDKATLTQKAKTRLDQAAATILEFSVPYVINGHTDSQGDDTYNQNLSEARAQSVSDYLVSQGVPEHRLATVGHGETMPIATNENADGRAANRRVEIDPVQ